MSAGLPMSLDDVRAAADRIAGHVWHTPVLRCPELDRIAGTALWLKAENLQRIGAFKARGAMHAIGRLPAETRAKGVITFSSGNHAQAVALAARTFGVEATVAMPTDAPKIKVAAVQALGASVVFAGTTSEERRAAALEIAEQTGGAVIHPFDDRDIVAGAGTATLELVEEALARTEGVGLDAVVVPVGGGGLIAGACLVCVARGIAVYSAEPHGCDALARSLDAGERVAVEPQPTIADGLKPVRIGELNFEIARRVVDKAFRVDDVELGRTLVQLLVRAKVLVEPSGAAALAVALRGELPGSPRNVGVLLSGGNVEPAKVAQLLERHGGEA
jgi:threonine dehydratase